MDTGDNPDRLRRTSRIVRPPTWQQDYVMTHPQSSTAQTQGQSHRGANAESHGSMDVKSLTDEMKQMKGMLMDLGQMVREMQVGSENSSFTTGSSENSRAASPETRRRDREPPVDLRTSLVQELGECLRQHQQERESVVSPPSPPRISRQSTLPPPPASMLPTPLVHASAAPPMLGPDVNAVPPAPHVETSNAHVPSNTITQYHNQPVGVPPESPLINQANSAFYPTVQQMRCDGPLQFNQMPGNAFPFPYPPCPPWMMPPAYPAFFPSGGFLRPPYLSYPVPNLSYGPPIQPECVAPVAAASQLPHAPSRLPLPSQTAPTYGSVALPASSPLTMPHATAVANPNGPMEINAAQYSGHPQPTAVPVSQSRPIHDCEPPPSRPRTSVATAQLPAQSSVPMSHTVLPPRSARIERPPFPHFRRDDPQEFAMLNMALTNLLPSEETEQYKFHILLDHLKLDSARHLALAYAHHPQPYTTALKALQKKYGQL